MKPALCPTTLRTPPCPDQLQQHPGHHGEPHREENQIRVRASGREAHVVLHGRPQHASPRPLWLPATAGAAAPLDGLWLLVRPPETVPEVCKGERGQEGDHK